MVRYEDGVIQFLSTRDFIPVGDGNPVQCQLDQDQVKTGWGSAVPNLR